MASIAAAELGARVVEALLPAPVRRSGLALLGANLLPLYGVLAWDWPVYHLMALYWAENVVAGAYTLLRMLAASPLGGLFLGAFFCVHYGMFCFVHGVFVHALFSGEHDAAFGVQPLVATILGSPGLLFAAGLMVASHGVSFVLHGLGGAAGDVGQIMLRPYGRMAVLHVTIIAAGFLFAAFGAPELVLAPLVLIKTVADLALHRRANAAAGPAPLPAVAPPSAPSPGRARPFEIP